MRLLKIGEVQALLLALMKKLHSFLEENGIEYYLIGGSALGAVRHQGFIPWDDDIDIGMRREDYERFLTVASSFDPAYEIVNFQKAKNCDFCLSRVYVPNTYVDASSTRKTSLDHRLYLDVFPLDNVPNSEKELLSYEKKIVRMKKTIQRIDVRDYNSNFPKMMAKKIVSFFLRPFRQRILGYTDRLMKKYCDNNTARICSLSSQYSFSRQVMDKSIYGKATLRPFCDTSFYVPEKVEQYLTILFGKDYMVLPPENMRRKGSDIYLIED